MEDSAQELPHIEYWIRAIVGLFYVRKTVKAFILEELHKQFDKISNIQCANCKEDILCLKCCSKLIGKKCKGANKINEPWAIAKSILGTKRGYSYSTAESLDVAGYLQILQFCDFITKSEIQKNHTQKVMDARNDLAHSPTFTIQKIEMEIMLSKMMDLVKSFEQFSQDVLSELKYLQSETYDTQYLLTGVHTAITEILMVVKDNSILMLVSKVKGIQGVTSEDIENISEKLHKNFIIFDVKKLKDLITNEPKSERQRQMKWEQQQKEKLLSEKCRENEQLGVIQARESNLSCELEFKRGKKTELYQKIDRVEIRVQKNKKSIESMKETEDKTISEIKTLQNKLLAQELNHKQLQEARQQLEITAQNVLQNNPFSETHQAVLHSVESKKRKLEKLKEALEKIEKNKESKLENINKGNFELERLNMKISEMQSEMVSLQQKLSKQAKPQKESASKQKAEKQDRLKENKKEGKKPQQDDQLNSCSTDAKQSSTKQAVDVQRGAFSSENVKETGNDIWTNDFASQIDTSSTQDTNVSVSEPRNEIVTSLKKVIKCAGNETALLYDGAYLLDGRLVVTDYIRNELFLFGDSVTLQAQYDVRSNPRGVCVSADGSLIYVVHDDGTLVTYRLQGGLKEVSRVKVQSSTTGVGVSGDTIITGHKDNITLYNMEGKELSSISKKGYPTYICVSQDGSRFYHRDGDHIVCRSVSDLTEVFRYSHPELWYPKGIACDRHGNILVTGYYSGNIIMIDKDGTHGRVLVDKLHGIRCPSGVCCHPQRDEFVVLGWLACEENVNAMEVYEMK